MFFDREDAIQTDRFRVNLKDLTHRECIDYQVKGSYDGTPLAVHVQIRVHRHYRWRYGQLAFDSDGEDSTILFAIKIGQNPMNESYLTTTTASFFSMACQNSATEKIEVHDGGPDAPLEVPYAVLSSNAFECGHVVMDLRGEFETDQGFYPCSCSNDYYPPDLEELLKACSYDLVYSKPPSACIYCSQLEDLPEQIKNQPSGQMDYFHDEPFTRDNFATFEIRVGKRVQTKLFVHPVIIAHASPVFWDVVTETGHSGSNQGYVEIKDASVGRVRLLLEGIYDPALMDNWERTFEFLAPMYTLADAYEVVNVKKACESMLRYLEFDTVVELCDVILFAEKHNLTDLMRRCCDCDVQKALPRDFWTGGPGKKFKDDHSCAFENYSWVLVKVCRCGPPLESGTDDKNRKRKHE